MNRVQRLQPVLRLADREVQKAARALATMQQRLQQEQDKLAQLQGYQQEYHEMLLRDGRGGVSAARLQLISRFSSNLDHAMEQQQRQIAVVRGQLDQVREHWREKDTRHRQLEKMMQRIDRQEEADRARIEQRNHDEFARRQAVLNRRRGP
ncbi:MAG: flagellar export protein FliJ [Pseudomonadota bacterium]